MEELVVSDDQGRQITVFIGKSSLTDDGLARLISHLNRLILECYGKMYCDEYKKQQFGGISSSIVADVIMTKEPRITDPSWLTKDADKGSSISLTISIRKYQPQHFTAAITGFSCRREDPAPRVTPCV